MIRWRVTLTKQPVVRWRFPRLTRTRDGSCLGCGFPEYKTPRPLGFDVSWRRYSCGVCGERFQLISGQKRRKT